MLPSRVFHFYFTLIWHNVIFECRLHAVSFLKDTCNSLHIYDHYCHNFIYCLILIHARCMHVCMRLGIPKIVLKTLGNYIMQGYLETVGFYTTTKCGWSKGLVLSALGDSNIYKESCQAAILVILFQ